MMTFILTFFISLVLLLAVGFFISFSKRRQRNTNHGLTGMCHETGGEMCGCCSSSLLGSIRTTSSAPNRPRCCDSPATPPTTRNN